MNSCPTAKTAAPRSPFADLIGEGDYVFVNGEAAVPAQARPAVRAALSFRRGDGYQVALPDILLDHGLPGNAHQARPLRRKDRVDCRPAGPSIESENGSLIATGCPIMEEGEEEPSLEELAGASSVSGPQPMACSQDMLGASNAGALCSTR